MIILGYGNKFSGLTRALIALSAGLVLIIWPGLATTLLVQAAALFFIIRGVLSFFFGGKEGKTFLNYLLEILLAVLLFKEADFVAGIIIYIIAFLLILLGVYQVFILLSSRRFFRGGGLLSVLPILVIVCAFLLLFAGGKNWVSYLAGTALILYGISDIVSLWTVEHYASKIFQGFQNFSRNGRHHARPDRRGGAGNPSGPAVSDQNHFDYGHVEEVDYEKVDDL